MHKFAVCIHLLSVLDLFLCLVTIATSFVILLLHGGFCPVCIKHHSCTWLWISLFNSRNLYNILLFFFFRRWTSFNWRFWPSQRHPSTLLYLRHRLTNFWSSFDQRPVWCCPPIYIWVFLLVKGFHLNIFLVVLASGILCIWPNQLNL